MNTFALVTLYYPDDSVRENIIQVLGLVDAVILLDNTPERDNSRLFSDVHNATYVAFKRNCGLSGAYNYCLKSIEKNCYVVFFDQDSWCPENLIEQLRTDYEVCRKRLCRQGVIGPAYFEKNAGKIILPRRKKKIKSGLYEVRSVITSGMFTELDVMRRIGFWNEEVFLDMADWDVCWRINKAGMFCCLTENAVLSHKHGKGVHRFAGVTIEECAPFRIYYQIRDGLYLLGKNYSPLKFRLKFVLMLIVRPIVHLLVLPEKRERIHYLLKGIQDYIRKIHGALPGVLL